MKKCLAILVCTLMVFFGTPIFAYDIEGVGSVTQVINGNDTLLFFRDEIHLKADTFVDWYATDGTLFQSDAQEIYPDDGGYYFIKNGTYQSSPIYAFLYSDAAAELAITAELDCEKTLLRIVGDVAPFVYTRLDGTQKTYARACTIQYNTLRWNGEAWEDSLAHMSASLHEGYYTLSEPIYRETSIDICYDAAIRIALGKDSACYSYGVQPEEIRAVKMQMTSLATTRNDSNEMQRPTSQDIIKASSTDKWSGPLEVAFYSNPTPAANHFNWTIYHGTDAIITRQDEDIRYTFSLPGSYRVVCSVNNQYCTSDSMEMVVAITESALLVPNVFTPNGDPHNNEFRVAYRSLREYHIWIYNRWGHLVYESTDPAKGWDGMIGNRPAAEGAYYYVIRALGTDAKQNAHYVSKPSYNSQKKDPEKAAGLIGVYQLSGDINLIR